MVFKSGDWLDAVKNACRRAGMPALPVWLVVAEKLFHGYKDDEEMLNFIADVMQGTENGKGA